MASAWGISFGTAWGESWGGVAPPVPAQESIYYTGGPGGSNKAAKKVRRRRPQSAPFNVDWETLLELLPDATKDEQRITDELAPELFELNFLHIDLIIIRLVRLIDQIDSISDNAKTTYVSKLRSSVTTFKRRIEEEELLQFLLFL